MEQFVEEELLALTRRPAPGRDVVPDAAGPPHDPADGRGGPGQDIYFKGAWVLHTLRYLIGDDAFFRALRRMAYPRKEMESYTDGRQQRPNQLPIRPQASARSGHGQVRADIRPAKEQT